MCWQWKQIVFEDVIAARDSATLEHLKELSSKRRVIEESINQTSYITEAIAREISGGLTSRCEQVIYSFLNESLAKQNGRFCLLYCVKLALPFVCYLIAKLSSKWWLLCSLCLRWMNSSIKVILISPSDIVKSHIGDPEFVSLFLNPCDVLWSSKNVVVIELNDSICMYFTVVLVYVAFNILFWVDNLLKISQERLRLEHYLPLLENFISHADLISSNSQMVHWTSQLKIRWSSATSSSSFFDLRGPKFFQLDNLRFELHFLYGATLRERASEFLSTGGYCWPLLITSAWLLIDILFTAFFIVVDLKQSAFIFREAAGVFHYLAHEVIPSLQSPISAERPSEASPALSAAMSFICLAEAQVSSFFLEVISHE